ncbi:hypothetical protein PAMP_015237 [Pampus punctatissimus]
MSNKTAELEKESTSQTSANCPRGNKRSTLSCPINRGDPGAPKGGGRHGVEVWEGGGVGGEEEGRKGRVAGVRSYCPYHWLMFGHRNGETAVIRRASAVAGFRLQHIQTFTL